MTRDWPNVIITGTPGVGKSAHAERLIRERPELRHLSINDVVREKKCHEGWDEEFQSFIVDEDKVLEATESALEQGGQIVDWHICDIFPLELIDLVVVLRTDHSILYRRLEKRKYKQSKIDENIDAEIMQVILDEANGAYREGTVVELQSNGSSDMEQNLDRIKIWIDDWRKNNKH